MSKTATDHKGIGTSGRLLCCQRSLSHLAVSYPSALWQSTGQECAIAPYLFKQNSHQIASAGNVQGFFPTPSFCLHQIENLNAIYRRLLIKWDYEPPFFYFFKPDMRLGVLWVCFAFFPSQLLLLSFTDPAVSKLGYLILHQLIVLTPRSPFPQADCSSSTVCCQ